METAVLRKSWTLLAAALLCATAADARAWSLEEAAKPYRDVNIEALFIDRPGQRAAISMISEFEARSGIEVTWRVEPYDTIRRRQLLDFANKSGSMDVLLIDGVWLGQFAQAGLMAPLSRFYHDPRLADPDFNIEGFFPLLLEAFGTWNTVVYGLPFDPYSGLLFYDRCRLEEAGFDGPPKTWKSLLEEYGPKLTDKAADRFAFAMPSRDGATQVTDSLLRLLWPFGGSLLRTDFKPNMMSHGSLEALRFRQELLSYMPPDVETFGHDETVEALEGGRVAMITEWSAFHERLSDSALAKSGTDCLGVSTEPAGPGGLKPPLGGFALGVNTSSSRQEQAAAWLFIQWLTSEQQARMFVDAGGVSARMALYEDKQIFARSRILAPMVESWADGIAVFRPRFAEWPRLSEHVSTFGLQIMRGDITVEDGAEELNRRIQGVLSEAGYYTGKRHLQ